MFDHLENYILDSDPLCKGAALCMLGDFNSRTGQLCDILEPDKTIDNLCTDNEMFECGSHAVFELADTKLERSSTDAHTNNYGLRLISLCKNLGVVIANGRIGADKGIGKTTCDGKSVIDYILCSPSLLHLIISFEVDEFCYLKSDKHNAINMSLKCNANTKGNNSDEVKTDRVKRTKWENDLENEFVQSINEDQINEINHNMIDNLAVTLRNDKDFKVDQNEMDTIVGLLNDCFNQAAVKSKISFKTRTEKWKRLTANSKWYNKCCEAKRKEYFRAKHKYYTNRSFTNKKAYKTASKVYKRQLRMTCNDYYKNLNQQLKQLKTQDSRQYWSILNRMYNKENTSAAPTNEELYDHFEKLNNAPDISSEDEKDLLNESVLINTEELDIEFAEVEVKHCIGKLKKNKAYGADGVLNEYLISTVDVLCPLYYTKLLNIVYNSGVIPSEWTLGIITPIYKKKGDRTNATNYRGITIVSCLGKLFTSLLNDRLQKYN